MRGHDGVAEVLADLVDHADDTFDVRLVHAAKHVVKDQHCLIGAVAGGEREEDAETKRIEMRLAEIGLRGNVVACKVRFQLN